jgi:hypothetical protein
VVAVGMPDVDHREMCRFSNKFHDGYNLIVERLTRLRKILLALDDSDEEDMRSTRDTVEVRKTTL